MSSVALGFGTAAIAVFCFGSNFLPVKKFEKQTGDGMFFQWVMCMAIWCVGLVVQAIRGFPAFEPLAMLGGFLWCTGNILSVSVIQLIGLGLGLLLWGLANLLMGWSSGTFGLFGLTKQTVPRPVYNYVGVAIEVVALVLYFFVKPNTTAHREDSLTGESTDAIMINDKLWAEKQVENKSIFSRLTPIQNKYLVASLP